MRPTRLAGYALLAFALLAAWQVSVIPMPPVYAEVGPHPVPAFVAGGLLVLALGYLLADAKRPAPDAAQDPEEHALAGARARLGWFAAGLLGFGVLLPGLGLGPAGGLAFAAIARAFDSQRPLADLAMGSFFTALIWLVFVQLLGVQLGPLIRGWV